MSSIELGARQNPIPPDIPDEEFHHDEALDNPLGFVTNEPLGSMLKIVRQPPRMHGPLQHSSGMQLAESPTEGIARSQKKLAATGLVLDLAELVINRESQIEASGDSQVRLGLEEVYRFLQHGEHLRKMREA